MIKFGIEIETCSKLVKSKKEYKSEYDYIPEYTDTLNSHFKTPLFINVIDKQKVYDEHVWMIDEDSSVGCNENGFHPIEIITPVFRYTQHDIDRFKHVFESITNKDEFCYETNKTQGIHINISHPNQNTLPFLQLWWIYEPLLLRFIPFERQTCLKKIAKPLRDIFSSFSDIEKDHKDYYKLTDSKYSAVSVRHDPDRFEIRIVNPSMDIHHILHWTNLCCSLLALSINVETIVKEDVKEGISDETIKHLFETLPIGKDTKTYFREWYNRYNSL